MEIGNAMKKLVMGLWEQYKAMSVPVKASLWFVFCNLVQSGINVISVPIFTRMMSTDEYGMFNTFYAWRNILMIFTSLNLSYGVFNNAMIKYEDSKTRDEYVSSMQGLYGLITLGFFAFYWMTRDWCNEMLGMSTTIVVMLFIELLCYPALLFWSARQRFEYKYLALVIVTIIISIASVGIGIIAVYFSEQKDVARIASIVGVDAVIGGGLFLYQFLKGRKFCIPKFWKFALKFNIPLIPHYLSEMILTQSDRIMIERMEGPTATANYSIAYSVATMLQLFMSAINASFVPWAYGCLKNKNYDALRKMGNVLLILISGLVLLMMLFAPELIMLFAGDKYAGAIYVIPPIALSVLFMMMYGLFATIEFYYGKNIFVMLASVGSAILNLILNWIFIPIFGYYAAGYTTVFCYAMYALCHYFFYRYICKTEVDGVRIFNEKWVLAIGGGMLLITIAINMVYKYTLIRFGIAVAIVAVFIWKKDLIIDRFKQMKAEK